MVKDLAAITQSYNLALRIPAGIQVTCIKISGVTVNNSACYAH